MHARREARDEKNASASGHRLAGVRFHVVHFGTDFRDAQQPAFIDGAESRNLPFVRRARKADRIFREKQMIRSSFPLRSTLQERTISWHQQHSLMYPATPKPSPERRLSILPLRIRSSTQTWSPYRPERLL